MADIAPMIATVVLMFVIGWSIKIVSTNRRLDRLSKMHNELQHKILEKFGTSEELLGYLGTDAGRKLLEAPVIDRGSPFGRILGSVQAGIILAVAGIGFLVVRSMVEMNDQSGVIFLGVLCVALGVGFLISAFAAHVLSKSYGLINGNSSETGI